MDPKQIIAHLLGRNWEPEDAGYPDPKRLGADLVAQDPRRQEAVFVRRRQRTVIFQDTRTGRWTEHRFEVINRRHWAYEKIRAGLDR